MLVVVSRLTGKKADSETFFTANRQSPWYLVAFGMVGASLSGITFISVPGEVGNSAFTYLQFVMGNVVGYWVVASVLLPVYYKMKLISIYTYLFDRFGFYSHKTGAFFFLLSRTIGASFRLFLVAGVLQVAIFDAYGIPFWITVLISIGLIWVYTFRGGIKTIVWTDTLQTLFLLVAVVFTIVYILNEFGWGISEAFNNISAHTNSEIFDWSWKSERNFFKQFFAGVFVSIAMVGLDQDMMQKNLTCNSVSDARKNMFWFSGIFLVTVIVFLALGVLLYIYAGNEGVSIPLKTDDLYPLLALNHMSGFIAIIFIIGIIAAAYSSADSALTSLTTSFCIDFLGFEKKERLNSERLRKQVHVAFSILLFFVVMIFKAFNNQSVVVALFRVAGYTYGPLLGLFAFGILTKRKIYDRIVPFLAIISPVISFFISRYSEKLFFGYRIGFELLIVNASIMFIGLLLFRKK
jgi:Na+/proline symporter